MHIEQKLFTSVCTGRQPDLPLDARARDGSSLTAICTKSAKAS